MKPTPMPQDQPTLPEILFDGFLVYQHLSERAASRTSPENVSDVLDAVVKALRASSHKGAALPEGVWISVKDRLPEEGNQVLLSGWTYGDDELRRWGRFYAVGEREVGAWVDQPGGADFYQPTHWMPLPQPPQESA